MQLEFDLALSDGSEPVPCEGSVSITSKQDAFFSVIKIIVVGFAVTLISVFIPIVHFISVPLGILATPSIATIIYFRLADQVSVDLRYRCPGASCLREVAHHSVSKLKQRTVVCPWCRASCSVSLVPRFEVKPV